MAYVTIPKDLSRVQSKVRIYQTNNLYSALVRQSQLEQEVKRIARKGRKTGKA